MRRKKLWRRLAVVAVASLLLAVFGVSVHAQEDTTAPEEAVETDTTALEAQVGSVLVSVDTVWVLATGFLVFFMQCGFALLETGLIRHTGAVNALLENFIDAGLTAIIFWAVGFGIAFGTDESGILGTDNFFLNKAVEIDNGAISFPSIADANPDVAYPNLAVLTFFFFQFAFAATASTITTGAMAERTDFIGDLIYTGLMAAFTYPVIVHWVWGGGWLFDRSFHDFAGSTVVHTVGGVTALVGAWMLGPRANRPKWGEMPPAHNLAYATLGTMILWFGWYGFNPGSTLGTGNTGLIGLVTLNTTLGAGAGCVSAMFFQWGWTGKWDLGITLNGSLAGLVAITAGCAFVMPWAAVVIGAAAGVLVILAVDAIERIRIDDPVGAFAVHGVCGIWGTLAIGLFGQPELTFGDAAGNGGLLLGGGVDLIIIQLMGSAATVAFIAVTAVLMFGALKAINRLRVHPTADVVGIDIYEHGASIWPDVLPLPGSTTESPAGASTISAPAMSGD
ncbi:MAG: ammonium transporter [Anaerolineae bacterium]|nr:MAG: ammonium transporter [Anaerolineae bacterium]